jgi:hypothetical protein
MASVCSRCGRRGPLAKDSATSTGSSSWCRRCKREAVSSWAKSPRGRAVRAWLSLAMRAGNRNGKAPAYATVEVRMTREEFLAWAIPAHTRWMCRHPGECPSVDRKNPEGHYEIGNLQILSQPANSAKHREDKNRRAPRGKAWCSGFCKQYLPVACFNKNRSTANGLQPVCRTCSKEFGTRWRRKAKLRK